MNPVVLNGNSGKLELSLGEASAYIPTHALIVKQDKVLMVMYAVAGFNDQIEGSFDNNFSGQSVPVVSNIPVVSKTSLNTWIIKTGFSKPLLNVRKNR